MKQIVKFEVFLSNEETLVMTKPAHVFERFFDCVGPDDSNAVFKEHCDFDWHVRNFVNGCREVFKHVCVNKTIVSVDFDFDLV